MSAAEIMYDEKLENNTESVLYALLGKDKDHVWAFCSGHKSQDFRGNPKYLFLYINKYRPDIFASDCFRFTFTSSKHFVPPFSGRPFCHVFWDDKHTVVSVQDLPAGDCYNELHFQYEFQMSLLHYIQYIHL